MLAQLEEPTNDFAALASYFIHGKTRPTHPDRVAWVFAQNLPTDDPLLAASYMQATAEMSRRCKAACWHTIISWREDERPSPEIMQEIARRTLEMAGLSEYQALIMGHGDRPHRHLHMMINRVHPETGKAFDLYKSHMRFDRIMKQLAEDYGFLYVPGHAFEPDLTDDLPKNPNSAARYAARRGATTGRQQWPRSSARRYGARISDHVDMATGWEDLEFLFAEDGLTMEWKGTGKRSGLVVGNQNAYTKFSALRLAASAKAFARRFGISFGQSKSTRRPPTRRSVWAVDAVDIARALGTRDQYLAAIRDATGQRLARRAKKPLMLQLLEELVDDLRNARARRNRRRAQSTTSLTSPRLRVKKVRTANRGLQRDV